MLTAFLTPMPTDLGRSIFLQPSAGTHREFIGGQGSPFSQIVPSVPGKIYALIVFPPMPVVSEVQRLAHIIRCKVQSSGSICPHLPVTSPHIQPVE